MLNKEGTRELAYLVHIDAIEPIEGSDNCEAAVVGGWKVMVRRNTFAIGEAAIYFEIDSKVDSSNPTFGFLAGKHYAVKTQRYRFGGAGNFCSQGLLMHPSDFGWEIIDNNTIKSPSGLHRVDDESRFLTQELKITYYVPEDNARKATFGDKYKIMAQRNSKLFSHQPFRWLMKHTWGKKLLFVFFGKKRDKIEWPSHIAAKTDVERIQNMIYILENKEPFVATEKVDGSSCSIMCERKSFGRIKQYICSRNVVFKAENQKCFYDTNIYYEAYYKYNLGEKIIQILKDYNLSNVALQMEIYGAGVQKRDYSTEEHKIAVFHIVSNGVKFSMEKTAEICEKYNIPHVPILDTEYILPDTIQELQDYVEKENSRIDNLPKEGIVFYSKDGQQYFKFVSPNFLIKYH